MGSGPGGLGPEGRADRRSSSSERDLLAERRARRAAESGEHALTLRAEAAEATVRTLETHVSSLQQRLREAEEGGQRASAPTEPERASPAGGLRPQAQAVHATGSEAVVERELRQVKQREYAEQRLRVEAEDQLIDLERESRAEVDRLRRRLGESELDARKLAGRLESVQRELAEADQAAAAELADLRSEEGRRAERMLQARVTELERRAMEIHRSLEAERAARERTERLLESMRRGHRQVEALVAELKGVVARLKAVAATPPPAQTPAPDAPRVPQAPAREGLSRPHGALPEAENGEMVEALAAAVERLRARVAEHAELTPGPTAGPPQHKHSQSLITRLRIARKQRRER